MTESSEHLPNRSGARVRRFALLWIAPAFLLAFLALLALEHSAPPRHASSPTIASPDESIAGFAARAELEGATLRVRLAPLHPDVERERFDASALRQRLGRGDGEPWRATLSLDVDPAHSTPNAIALDSLRIVDDDGDALTALAPPETSDDRASDPLRTLLAPPTGPLSAGSSLEIVLFGRAPRSHARLLGLAGSEIALAPTAYRRAELELPIARLDVAGKKPAAGSSAPDASPATNR